MARYIVWLKNGKNEVQLEISGSEICEYPTHQNGLQEWESNPTKAKERWKKRLAYWTRKGFKLTKEKGKNPLDSLSKAEEKNSNNKLTILKEDCKEVAAMWRNDEYDNLKDVIQDALGLWKKAEGAAELLLAKKMHKILVDATKQLDTLSKKNLEIKAYSKGLIDSKLLLNKKGAIEKKKLKRSKGTS